MDVRFEGYDELNKRLKDLGQVGAWGRPIIEKALDLVHDRVPPYPRAAHRKFPFVSDKQRRYVMWAIRNGIITVPYRRTAQLGKSITTEVKSLSGNDIVGVIGTGHVAAPWVISNEKVGSRGPQAQYHQGVWWTLQDIVAKQRTAVVDLIESEVRKLLQRKV